MACRFYNQDRLSGTTPLTCQGQNYIETTHTSACFKTRERKDDSSVHVTKAKNIQAQNFLRSHC